MTEFTLMRRNMVNFLLKPNGIKHARVLHAFQEVSRETFLSGSFVNIAYGDQNIYNRHDEKLLKPLTIAKILQALNLATHNKILIIGSTNLYTAALLSYCCREIHLLCQNPSNFQKLNSQLNQYSSYSIRIHQGYLTNNFISYAPYDHIFIEGGIKSGINLIKQYLKTGGSIIYLLPLNHYSNYRVIKETRQQNGKCIKENLFECDGFMVNDYQSAVQIFEL